MSEPRHTKSDLAQMQSLPLSAKILMTKRRIREWYEHFEGQVYVSFSGGKDSTVQRMKVTHPNQYKYCMKPVSEGGLGLSEVLDFIGVKYE